MRTTGISRVFMRDGANINAELVATVEYVEAVNRDVIVAYVTAVFFVHKFHFFHSALVREHLCCLIFLGFAFLYFPLHALNVLIHAYLEKKCLAILLHHFK